MFSSCFYKTFYHHLQVHHGPSYRVKPKSEAKAEKHQICQVSSISTQLYTSLQYTMLHLYAYIIYDMFYYVIIDNSVQFYLLSPYSLYSTTQYEYVYRYIYILLMICIYIYRQIDRQIDTISSKPPTRCYRALHCKRGEAITFIACWSHVLGRRVPPTGNDHSFINQVN